MMNRKWTQVLSGAIILFSLIVMLLYRSSIVLSTLMAFIILCLWWGSIWMERKIQKDHLQTAAAEKQAAFIRTLNHHRHDWMNDLQVIFGYLSLKKYDKLLAYVEKIKEKLARESKISKLGDPAVIMFFLAFRTQCNVMNLDVEMDREINLSNLPLNSFLVQKIVQQSTESFSRVAKPSYDESNNLVVKFAADGDQLDIVLEYSGVYDSEELRTALQRTIDETRDEGWNVKYQADFQERNASVGVSLPFCT